jgi:hypothetical protein
MCIFRYVPSNEPSASMMAAVLWYRPEARRSKSDAITTTPCFFASLLERRRCSAREWARRDRRTVLSLWQKYCEVTISCVQMIWAPFFAAR